MPQVLCMSIHRMMIMLPLGAACRNNLLEVVKVLIENGAMVNYRDKVYLDSIYSSYGWLYTQLLYLCVLIGWMDVSSPCY